MIFQAAELGDTGRQVVLWVAMALALWQLLMFAASTFVQGENLPMVMSLGLSRFVMVAHLGSGFGKSANNMAGQQKWQSGSAQSLWHFVHSSPSSFHVIWCTAHHLLASVMKVYTKS